LQQSLSDVRALKKVNSEEFRFQAMSKDSQAPVDKDYASGADPKMVVDPKAV
jgi:hypothetical protein